MVPPDGARNPTGAAVDPPSAGDWGSFRNEAT